MALFHFQFIEAGTDKVHSGKVRAKDLYRVSVYLTDYTCKRGIDPEPGTLKIESNVE